MWLLNPYRFGGWTPANITTALWLDAADASTITTVSGAVSEWRDKSGNGRHAAQATADQRPTYSALSFNNLNSVLFGSGTPNDFLRTTNAGLPTGNGARSIFVAYKPNRANGVNPIVGQALSPNANSWFILHARDTADPYLAGYSNDVNSTIAPNTNPKSAGVTHNGSTCVLYLNGTSVGTRNTTFNTNTSELSVGGNGVDEYLFGLIGEVIYFSSAVDTAIRQQIEGYLAHKWGLTANLPSGHPYKSTPPYL